MKSNISKSYFLVATQTLITYSLRLGLLLLTAKLINVEDFGFFATISALYTLLYQPFLCESFTNVYIRKYNSENKENLGLFLSNFLMYIVGSILFSSLFLSYYDYKNINKLLLLFLLIFSGFGYFISSSMQAILKVEERFFVISKVNIVSVFSSSLIGALTAFYLRNVWALFIPIVVEQILSALLYFYILVLKEKKVIFKFDFSYYFNCCFFVESKKATSFYLVAFLSIFNQRAVSLVSGYFLSPVQVGLLFMAQRIQQMIMQVISTSTGTVIFPYLSKGTDNSDEKLGNICSTTLLIFSPILTLISVNSSVFFNFVGDGQWNESKELFDLFLITCLPYIIAYNFDAYIMAKGKQVVRFNLLIFNAFLSFFVIAFFSKFGVYYVALFMTLRVYLSLFLSLLIWNFKYSFKISYLVTCLILSLFFYFMFKEINRNIVGVYFENDIVKFIIRNLLIVLGAFFVFIYLKRMRKIEHK